MWIDSHCHLNHEKILPLGNPHDLVISARNANVKGMLTICCMIHQEKDELTAIAEKENIWCSIGTHPHNASNENEKSISLDDLIYQAQSHPLIIGIGESGLDYYYNYSTPDDQELSFRKHIRACIACDLPLIVHARDADKDIMRILKDEAAGKKLKGVMHCFSSSAWLAEEALAFGFYISFSGIVTFKKATDLQEIAKSVPLERLLVETDAPYLAPDPYRGKINEPAMVEHTGAFLAGLHNVSVEHMANVTTDNFFTLFSKAQRP